jgi:hypothetical protein
LALVVAGLGAWFGTQALIGSRPERGEPIGDVLLEALDAQHAWLVAHPRAADALLVVSSAIIDGLGLFLLGRSILGPTVRPFLALLLVFLMRQVCQALCIVEPPAGMIWRYPGLPSLLVTYQVANDMFFSGHTALAVVGAVELGRLRFRGAAALGLAVAAFEIAAVLLLRAHWTMDVVAGALAALVASVAADRAAATLDRWLTLRGRA